MANRSDFQSDFPRYLKRLWIMTKHENAHEAGEWKRDFRAAHAIHRDFKNKKQGRIEAEDTEE